MRGIGFWRPALGALTVLAFTLDASAVNINKKVREYTDQAGGEVTPPGPPNTTMSPANDCSAPHAAGVLNAAGGTLSGDTFLAGDNFGDVFGNCGYDVGVSGEDEIWEFQVDSSARWTFDTCTIPAGWDTSLGLYYDIGIGCPGLPLVCNGDDPCGSFFESAIRDVCLAAGTTYWLVVDGWSPYTGGYYDVTYSRTVDPCATDADCDDGDLCNGIETCVDGCCEQGPDFCERWEECDPVTQTCFNSYDPCTSWASNEDLPGSFSPQCFNGCPGATLADDIQLHPGTGHELISYQTYTQARNLLGAIPGQCETDEPLGTLYSVHTDLWDTAGGGACTPNAIIAGASCDCADVGVVAVSGTGADICLCEPNGGLPTGIMLPTGDPDPVNGQCGVDFFIGVIPGNSGSGVSLAQAEQFLGGPALDDEFGLSVMLFEDCDVGGDTGVPQGTFSFGAFGAPTVSDGRGMIVCTNPSGPCCYDAGGCDVLTPDACTAAGGTLIGLSDPSNPLDCSTGDDDGDGFFFSCDNCDGVSNPDQRDCDGDGEGDACEADPANQDDDNDGTCNGVDGCPNDPLKTDPGQCGCGFEDIDSDGDNTADCNDNCPLDPNKTEPGACGCGSAPEDDADDDGDGFENCIDQCAGVDDNEFAPGCAGAIPTVSEWGIAILALLLLVAGKVYFGRRTATA